MKKILGITVMSLAWIMQSCGGEGNTSSNEGAATDSTQRAKVKYVEVSEVQPQSFNHYIEAQGVADTDNNVMVTAKTAGTVSRVNVTEGAKVRKGQTLLSLDDDIIRNSMAEVRTQLDLATELYNKQKSLWDENIGSEVQFLQAKGNKESLETRLATLREQLALTRVTAPISGVVEMVNVKPGEMASPGIPLVQVVNLTDFEIKAAVAENYALAVKEGSEVNVSFPDLKADIDAKISFVGNVIDPINRTFNIVVRIKNPSLPVKPNMICVVKILDFQSDEAMVIPVNTIQTGIDGKYVFVAKTEGANIIARKKMIKAGLTYQGKTLVEEGLTIADQLITFGFQDLTDGQIIKY